MLDSATSPEAGGGSTGTGTVARGAAPEARGCSGCLQAAGLRVDTVVDGGYSVHPFSDSLIPNVIVHARTRELAIARMRRALEAMVVEGIITTIPLHLKIMDDPKFRAGDISTNFMEYFL